MGKQNVSLLAWNRGIVSKNALARVDVERIRLSAEIMENWTPKTQGSMFLRCGLGYIGTNRNNAPAIDIPFVASTTDTALIELANGKMRVRVNDVLLSRVAVATTIPNGNFASSSGWTEAHINGASATFGGSGLVLNAINRGATSIVRRVIAVATGDQGRRHALKIEVTRGPVVLRVGSTVGGDEYIAETTLRRGVHSLGFTPAGNVDFELQSASELDRIVKSVSIEPVGTMELDIPWNDPSLKFIRYTQSADVVFVACNGYSPRRIERRSTDSWSVVYYDPENGPFTPGRTSKIKLKPGDSYGNTTLTADKAFFKPGHVGALFRLYHEGVDQTFKLAANGEYSDPFRVTGVNDPDVSDDRNWTYGISGTWSGTLNVLRSFEDENTGFSEFRNNDASSTTGIAANVSFPTGNTDGDDNSIVFYKIGFKEGTYTSGQAIIRQKYEGSGGYGICRVLSVSSPNVAVIEVLDRFTTYDATATWQESVWSDYRGWPSAVDLHKGRLFFAGKTRFIGSVSDDYENFDPDYEGDSGPIDRSLGSGPVDVINFLISLGRLIAGTDGAEYSIKSTSFDEPLTPQNTQADAPSTQGSRSGVNAVKIDNRGIFAQRSGKRIFELLYDTDAYDYRPRELTLLCPDITGSANVAGMAVQRQPDTRVHIWLDDGTVILLTYEPEQEVTCWSRFRTDGFVEYATVLPGQDEDQVYYRVRRIVNGNTMRYLEKFSLEAECIGGAINKQADCFVVKTAINSNVVSGLSHLEGKSVIVWADGEDLSPDVDGVQQTYVVSGGSITLGKTVQTAMIGLPYSAPYKSTKLAYAAAAGTALAQNKRVLYFGVIARNMHNNGLKFGRSFTDMDPLPRQYEGRPIEPDDVFEDFDEPALPFPGAWSTDSRVYLKATAPRPVELLAAILSVEANDKL